MVEDFTFFVIVDKGYIKIGVFIRFERHDYLSRMKFISTGTRVYKSNGTQQVTHTWTVQ